MTTLNNTFEGGTNGVGVTLANSGGVSGNAWNDITIAGAGTFVYSNVGTAHGSLGGRVTVAGGTDRARVYHSFAATNTAAARFYIYLHSLPSASGTKLFAFADTAFSQKVVVGLTAANKIFYGTISTAFANSLTANTLYRVEVSVTKGTTISDGKVKIAYYLGDNASPVETAIENLAFDTGTNQYIRTMFGAVQLYRACCC